MAVLIAKNIEREGAGIIEEVLKEKGIEFEICELEKEPFPNPLVYSAVIVMGGSDSANDKTEKMISEVEAVRKIVSSEIPYLGICLGMQALMKSQGAVVRKNEMKEIGFIAPDGRNFSVELTEEGRKDAIFDGLPEKITIFQLHGETAELAKGAKLLANGKYCKNQAVKVGSNAYSFQFHFELTEELLSRWAEEDEDLKKMDRKELLACYDKIRSNYEKNGRKMIENFLEIAGF